MKRFLFVLMISISAFFNFSFNGKIGNGTDQKEYSYYSDYFVFIADDGGTPLVIPIDINWSITATGYESEFKGWYGTKKEWPIGYFKNQVTTEVSDIPQEPWQHKDGPYFQFNATERKITSTIKGAPKVQLRIPERSSWVQMPSKDGHKEIYGFRTTSVVKKKKRSGWMLYERIRWNAETVREFGDFEAFFWIPLVLNDSFYHFEQHKDIQTATKWSIEDGKITVTALPNFELHILSTNNDPISGRKNIPKKIRLKAEVWNLDIILKSTGSQVGHGTKFPNGLAYYRQSLLQLDKGSPDVGYGMLELILEND